MEHQVNNEDDVVYITIKNSKKTTLMLSTYGATIVSVKFADLNGKIEEITLFDKVNAKQNAPYYGCTVGRVANRIGKGKMQVEGKDYQLAVNNGANHLHGGIVGFDKKIWTHTIQQTETCIAVIFSYTSLDGEEGYPGTLQTRVTYSLDEEDNIRVQYHATTDAPTPVNLTNHAYWNLSGDFKTSILTHELQVVAEEYLPVDATQIPTGERRSVAGSAFDLRQPTLLHDVVFAIDGGGQPGLDHCFVVERRESLRHVATLTDPASRRVLQVSASQPGLQVYTANWLSAVPPHAQHYAVCLETQHFPDAVNQPEASHDVILRPGQVYAHEAVFALRHC